MDQIVTDYTTITSTNANTLIGQILAYHSSLSANLFQVATLDAAHLAQVAAVDKTALLSLRNRIDAFLITLGYAIRAGQ